MITYIDDTLEGTKNSGNRAEEYALQEARLANDDFKQVLVDHDKLQKSQYEIS